MSKIVIDARSRGSTGRVANKLIEHLQQIDVKNEYVILKKSAQEIPLHASNFSSVNADVEDYTFAEQLSLWWKIRRLKPDIVHFTMPQQPILPLGARRVTMIHDLTMLRFHNINSNKVVYYIKLMVFRFLLWWVAHTSAAVTVPTRWVKTDIVKTLRVDPIRVHVTYEAAEPINASAVAIKTYEDVPYILFNGNVFPHKNVRRLVSAHQALRKKHKHLRLVIAGKLGEQGVQLKRDLHEAGVKDVDFLDFVPDPEMKWLWQNARVYVYPGLSEGFGLPGLESMLVGTPVASSNATCLPEVYEDAAAYFDPYSVEDMTATIDRILTDADYAKKLVTQGRKQVKKYSWQRFTQQTLDIYNNIA